MTTTRDSASSLVRKLWHYCNVLRDDGLSYPDYVEQLTYLLFLKMSDEQAGKVVPEAYAWRSFVGKNAQDMHQHYSHALKALGRQDGMLGMIFRDARNKIRDPLKLRLLIVELIGQTQWIGLSPDVKGDAYEGLLEKNARDTKSGAGQYFTPRPLIDAIVRCVRPRADEVICDPACGTGGFLLAAHSYIRGQQRGLSPSQIERLNSRAIRGVELVPEVARLATMNLLLHGIGNPSGGELPIGCSDSLKTPPKYQVDVVLTNPPFGTKGSATYANANRTHGANDELRVVRPDFQVQTANKQLNFVQHVVSLLKPGGRAAILVPDNVLFEGGVANTLRRSLMESCDVHTLLRLPTGLFYAQGVQANVLFFDKPIEDKANPSGRMLWIYDLRAGSRFSLKTNPLAAPDLEEFTRLYCAENREEREATQKPYSVARWRSFSVADLLRGDQVNLDISWSKDISEGASGGVERLDEISRAIAVDLQKALEHVASVLPRRSTAVRSV